MLAKTTHLHAQRASARQELAMVTATDNGLATTVSLAGEPLRVTGHLQQIDYLQCGDQVLITVTDTEVIINGRLRRIDEELPQQGGQQPEHLELEASQSIRLTTPKGRIEIHADGQIIINGRQLIHIAEGPLRLQGAKIELN